MGSCGSALVAGPKITSAPRTASNVDWWHGHNMWCVVCSYRAAGQPTCVQIFEYATMLSTVQFCTTLPGSGRALNVITSGGNLMMITAALARALKSSWKPSGTTVIIPPGELKSAGLIGVLAP